MSRIQGELRLRRVGTIKMQKKVIEKLAKDNKKAGNNL
jgi:hypothetical protein